MSSRSKIVRDGGFSKRAHAITSDVSAERQARLLRLRGRRGDDVDGVARHSEYSTRMENDRGRGEGSVPDQTREGETQVIREKGEERRKEREEWHGGNVYPSTENENCIVGRP